MPKSYWAAAIGGEFSLFDLKGGAKTAQENVGGGGSTSAPVAGDGVCYFGRSALGQKGFGSGRNEVWSLDTTREKKTRRKWSQSVGDDLKDLAVSNVAQSDKLVYAASNYRVAAFDRQNGKRVVAP